MSAIRARADFEIGVHSDALETGTLAGPGRGHKTKSHQETLFSEGKIATLKAAHISKRLAYDCEAFVRGAAERGVDLDLLYRLKLIMADRSPAARRAVRSLQATQRAVAPVRDQHARPGSDHGERLSASRHPVVANTTSRPACWSIR